MKPELVFPKPISAFLAISRHFVNPGATRRLESQTLYQNSNKNKLVAQLQQQCEDGRESEGVFITRLEQQRKETKEQRNELMQSAKGTGRTDQRASQGSITPDFVFYLLIRQRLWN